MSLLLNKKKIVEETSWFLDRYVSLSSDAGYNDRAVLTIAL